MDLCINMGLVGKRLRVVVTVMWAASTLTAAVQALAAPGGDQLAATPVAALGQAAALASTCSGCHSGSGAGSELVNLRTLEAREIQSRMATFKRETQGATVMHRLARGYSDAQIALIARHIASPADR